MSLSFLGFFLTSNLMAITYVHGTKSSSGDLRTRNNVSDSYEPMHASRGCKSLWIWNEKDMRGVPGLVQNVQSPE